MKLNKEEVRQIESHRRVQAEATAVQEPLESARYLVLISLTNAKSRIAKEKLTAVITAIDAVPDYCA